MIFGRENTKNARLVSVSGVEYASIKKVDSLPGDWTKQLRQNWDSSITSDPSQARRAGNGQIYGRIPSGGTAVARYEGLDASYDGKKIVAVEYRIHQNLRTKSMHTLKMTLFGLFQSVMIK